VPLFQISAFVVLALTFQSALSAPGVAAPVAYAPAPAPVAAYAPAVPYNIPPFAAALNLQTRALTAPLVAAPAYAPAPVVLPAAYAAPAGIAPAYSVSNLFCLKYVDSQRHNGTRKQIINPKTENYSLRSGKHLIEFHE
jgi:hypothetical protein